jgi:ATP-binding cassette, subfamily F, member 3
METSTDLDSLLVSFQEKLDLFQAMDGDNYESNINKKLHLADLGNHKSLAISKLSGGEYKLVQVIREMLLLPQLMIMDEPDIFLDFENLNALRSLINSYKGNLLVITHNRYLLHHCFNKIIHLENMELQEFDGRYMDYTFALLLRKIELQELAQADNEEIARNEHVVTNLRNIATTNSEASRGRALHARVTHLDRLKARRVKEPFVEIQKPAIVFHNDNEPDDHVILSLNHYSVGFQEPLLKDVSFELRANEKVALIGANGTGKTTLLRDLFQHSKDSIFLDDQAKVAFLSQLQGEMLNEDNTVMDEFLDAGVPTQTEVKKYLLQYGFDESINQRISSLSGGEKNLLQLAKIGLGKANLLLLDEPNSHLDTYAQIALEEAIQEYHGAVLMISHDFYTIANCMDYVLIIENQTIRKMRIRTFRKMIYANHFDQNYLELERQKKEVETQIDQALLQSDFLLAKTLSEDLELLINQL